MAGLVATTYATALFDVSVELNEVDKFMDEVAFIKASIEENPVFFDLLKTPRINIHEKKNILENVYGGKVSKEVMSFLKILVDKRRIKYLLEIADEFKQMAYDYKGIVMAKVYSKDMLSDEKIKKLEEKLGQKTGKTVIVENIIDDSLLGGLMIKFNDIVVDGTLKGKLKKLEDSLNRIIV